MGQGDEDRGDDAELPERLGVRDDPRHVLDFLIPERCFVCGWENKERRTGCGRCFRSFVE